jgi:iron complex outermembrane recepter protein
MMNLVSRKYSAFRSALTAILSAFAVLISTEITTLQGQTVNDTLSVELEEIKVEAAHSIFSIDRASISVSTLRRSLDDLTARRASTMDELTFTLPGVWISNRENHALGERMTVRGMGWRSQFGVRGIQVVLDDIPLTVADGQTVMNMIDPAMVQSLELLRGPSATFWGNSSGGVLYMRTRPASDSPNFYYRGYLGSFNTMKQEIRWHDRIGGVRWNAYGTYYDTDGYRDYSAAQLIRSGISAGFDITEESSFEARVIYAGMPNAEHPGSLSGEDAENSPSMAWPFNVNTQSGKEFHQLMGSGQYIQNFNSGLFTLLAHGTYRDLKNPLPGPYILVDRWAGGTRATYDFNNLPFDLQIGGEMNWQRDDRQQRNNDGGEPGNNLIINQLDQVRSQGLFARSVFDFNQLTLSVGLRGDRMVFAVDDFIDNAESSRTFTTLNPSVGVHYNFGNLRWFSNFSTSFESPTTTEFKNRLGTEGTILPGFNPDLDPEKTIGIETGFRGYFDPLNLDYEIAGFYQHVTDQIIQETEIDGEAIFSNGGNADHFGIETHFRLNPVNFLSLELMYTWIDARFAGGQYDEGMDFEGNRLPGVAPHRFGSILSLFLGNHTISTDVEWIGEYYADSENSAVNDSYLLMNGRWTFAGFDFDNWKIQPFISVYNIFNTRYNTSVAVNNNFGRFFEPGSSRSFQGGFSIQI